MKKWCGDFNKGWKLKSFKFKIFFIGLICLSFTGIVSAIWLLSYDAETGLTISSDEPISFSDTFLIEAVDVSNSDYQQLEYLNLSNDNGALDFNITINSSFIDDTGDGCSPNEDYVVNIKYDGTSLWSDLTIDILDSKIISVPTGESAIEVETNVKRLGCPAQLRTKVFLVNAEN